MERIPLTVLSGRIIETISREVLDPTIRCLVCLAVGVGRVNQLRAVVVEEKAELGHASELVGRMLELTRLQS